jgi:hypothetical protein|tara:strand:- start:1697 stop:1924 length:228 start_codon:yes stop_codon:yes gene_type:complete
MSKADPKTTKEHIISLYGHIEGIKRDVKTIKENHLEHMHQDIDKIDGKIDKLLFWLLGGLLTIILTLVGSMLYGG